MSRPSPWRPRLVEEGKPLYGDDDKDHSMDEADPDRAASSSPAAASRPQLQSHGDGSLKSSPRPSSLAMAAGGRLPGHPHHLTTHLEVKDHHDEVLLQVNSDEHSVEAMSCSPPRKASPLRMRLVIGEEAQSQRSQKHHVSSVSYPQHHHHEETTGGIDNAINSERTVERMKGVENHEVQGPLVVMDGANLAYAYADAMAGFDHGSSTEPDARGIQVAANYFLSVGVRVLVVIPAPWFRVKPRAGDEAQGNAMMITPQLEVLKDLKARGLLVAAPPRDDDDAYALTIARREDSRSRNRGGHGGFVLSCDMFRDAVNRDSTGELRGWLTKGTGNGPGRISFAFCDMGSTDDYGDREMDFVPNPRHPLVALVEGQHSKNSQANTY